MNKIDFQNMLLQLVEPVKCHYSKGKAELDLGAVSAGYGSRIGRMEGFSRILWGMVPYWAGGGEDKTLLPTYIEGITNGTNPDHEEYWGDLGDKDQRMVEMAALSYGILMIPELLWEPLSENAKNNFANWLNQINDHTQAENNWQYFLVLVNMALKSVGKKWNKARVDKAMEKYESFYIGNGWYGDGLRPQKDYYVSFAIHYYCMLYAKVMKKEDTKRCELFCERAKTFYQSFIYWFDKEGKALPFGRSLTYRFAQAAFFSMYALAEVDNSTLPITKGMISRHLAYWMKQPMFDNGGILTVGYTYPNSNMAEGYNGAGSPYWALKTFAFLALEDSHPFWSVEEAPFPLLDNVKTIKECDMVICHTENEVVALTSGQYPVMNHTHGAEKYAKFAYSSLFGFSVPRSYYYIEEAAPDSMLAFYVNEMYYVRRKCDSFLVDNNKIVSTWTPVQGITVETTLEPIENGHRRIHKVISSVECEALECGFSYPNNMVDVDIYKGDSVSLVKDKNGESKVESCGGEGMVIKCVPQVNLIFPNTYLPAVKHHISLGETIINSTITTHFTTKPIYIGKSHCYKVEEINYNGE